MSAGGLRVSGGENSVIGVELVGRARAGEPRARRSDALRLILPLALARGAGWVPLFPTLHLAHV